jgi:nitroreductase
VAGLVIQRLGDGIWLIDLDPVGDRQGVAGVIAAALGPASLLPFTGTKGEHATATEHGSAAVDGLAALVVGPEAWVATFEVASGDVDVESDVAEEGPLAVATSNEAIVDNQVAEPKRIELLDAECRPVVPMDTAAFDLIWSQRACRSYLDDRVPSADLVAMVKSASHAPSAENSQPWVIVVVDEPAVRASVDELTHRLWRERGRAHSEVSLSSRFFAEVDTFFDSGYGGAPCLIVVAGDARDGSPKALLAASVFPAAQNLLLAAAALGYGSAMTTLAAQAPVELGEILGLPEGVVPFAVIPVGHSSRRLGPPRRRPVNEIAHHNRFGEPFG